MNPMKVFGGRVTAGRVSYTLGFLAGFSVALLLGLFGPRLLGWQWLSQLLESSLIASIPIPLYLWISLFGGFMGLLVIRMMTLNQALSIGIPILRILSKIFKR